MGPLARQSARARTWAALQTRYAAWMGPLRNSGHWGADSLDSTRLTSPSSRASNLAGPGLLRAHVHYPLPAHQEPASVSGTDEGHGQHKGQHMAVYASVSCCADADLADEST